jgi:UDP-3-O-acyl-N-acetylglucosamine deacetylase
MVLKTDDAHLVHDERILRRDALRLQEELVCKLDVVGQTTLQADVQQW